MAFADVVIARIVGDDAPRSSSGRGANRGACERGFLAVCQLGTTAYEKNGDQQRREMSFFHELYPPIAEFVCSGSAHCFSNRLRIRSIFPMR